MEELPRMNSTPLTYFVLLGWSSRTELQILIFCIFMLVYVFTLVGNCLIVVVTLVDASLQTPMYFFLRVLSILDMIYSSVTIPKILLNSLLKDKSISYTGCVTQMYLLLFLGVTECVLLAVMAYDRYIAICNPLRYMVIMNKRVCLLLSLFSVMSGNMVSLMQTMWVFSFPFCGSNKIDYFFCDIPPLLKLTCIDTSIYESQLMIAAPLVICAPFILIFFSYVLIISSIVKMASVDSRWKSFSTCSSHLLVVILFYGTSSMIYIKPNYILSEDTRKIVALIYTTITPLLNPVIYSIRNAEVQRALKKNRGSGKIFSN